MSLTAKHADRVVAMHEGQVIASAPPAELFQQHELLSQTSLAAPPVLALAQALVPYGLKGDSLTAESFCNEYAALFKERAQSRSGQSTGAQAESG